MRNLAIYCLVLLLAGSLTSCDSDGSSDSDDYFGTYQLDTIDGHDLPFAVFESGADKIEITSGTIRLSSNMTYTTSTSIRMTMDGVVTTDTETDTGSFTKTGSSLTVFDVDGSDITGTLNGDTITFSVEGLTMVFKN